MPLGGNDAAQIFRRSFVADEKNFLAFGRALVSAVGVEINPQEAAPRARARPLQAIALAFWIAWRGRKSVRARSSGRLERADGGFPIDQAFLFCISTAKRHRRRRAFAIASLEHEQLSPSRMVNSNPAQALKCDSRELRRFFEVGERFRHRILQQRHRLRSARAGDDILALRVNQNSP